MSRDTSPQARIALAEELWQFARTGPSEIAELMHTNDLAVDILRTGMNLSIQHAQSQERDQGKVEDEMPRIDKVIIVLDSNDGHITRVFTNDPSLIVRVVDIDTEAQEPVWGLYDPGVKVVDAAAMEHHKENVPGYKPEEEEV